MIRVGGLLKRGELLTGSRTQDTRRRVRGVRRGVCGLGCAACGVRRAAWGMRCAVWGVRFAHRSLGEGGARGVQPGERDMQLTPSATRSFSK